MCGMGQFESTGVVALVRNSPYEFELTFESGDLSPLGLDNTLAEVWTIDASQIHDDDGQPDWLFAVSGNY